MTKKSLPIHDLDSEVSDPRDRARWPRPPFITIRISVLGALSIALVVCYVWFGAMFAAKYSKAQHSTAGIKDVTIDLPNHCVNTSPIASSEFHERQRSLAETLHHLNASAYIAEPGASAQFYGNVSLSQWWLSERPLLLIVTPEVIRVNGHEEVQAKVSVLTPQFEATRARMLPIPFSAEVEYAEWPEHINPYEVAAESLKNKEGKVFVDGSIRNFIVDGLRAALPQAVVSTAPTEVKLLRERKSNAELELMKCANEATLLSIRAVRKKMYIGMRESEARDLMSTALAQSGLKDGGCLTLFGENAALPHGSGSNRLLGKSDFALFDCTASLHGYQSDVTRTIALPSSDIPSDHIDIWNHVHAAQAIALHTAHQGTVTRKVDEAARGLLQSLGYGEYFTHRLGHGIGLEVHEDPYLRGGSEDVIDVGHTFSDEPGVYIEGKVGVRLEDCFYISEDGSAIFLTAAVGGPASSPWSP